MLLSLMPDFCLDLMGLLAATLSALGFLCFHMEEQRGSYATSYPVNLKFKVIEMKFYELQIRSHLMTIDRF